MLYITANAEARQGVARARKERSQALLSMFSALRPRFWAQAPGSRWV